MSKEQYIHEYLASIDVKLRVILGCGTQEEYNLEDVSLSLLRKSCEACGFTLHEEDAPNGWSYDYVYSIRDSKNKVLWIASGSLWYGGLKLTKK